MIQVNRQLARDFFAAVSTGNLPDELLTPDMTGWTTMQGAMDKKAYQGCVKILGTLCTHPIVFTISSLTAEENRVVAEVQSAGTLINGEEYRNTYVFVFTIHDGRIASVAEHFNPIIVQNKLIPLMGNVMNRNL